jgi:Lrp/AsnC family transcriptional regulator for asnA, asnC and gidA
MSIPDSIDVQLVRLLGQDARQNSEILAKQLNVSSATIRRKLRRLIQSGSLRIVGVVDPARFGLPLTAIIALDVAQEKLKSAIESLANRPEITWISTTTGRFDIIARGWFASTDDLSNFLVDRVSTVDGIKNSETFICLDLKKGHQIPFPAP